MLWGTGTPLENSSDLPVSSGCACAQCACVSCVLMQAVGCVCKAEAVLKRMALWFPWFLIFSTLLFAPSAFPFGHGVSASICLLTLGSHLPNLPPCHALSLNCFSVLSRCSTNAP